MFSMAALRILIKLILFVFAVSSYVILSILGKIFIRDFEKRRTFYTKNVSRHTRLALKILQANVKVINPPPEQKSYLFVGNHLGFVDIFLLSSVRPCMFITSVEMKNTPFLGQMCEMGGSLFVERRSRDNIGNEVAEIRNALKNNHNVVLYPEGTSTNGEKILPFKKTLMTAAAGTGIPIMPVVVNYTHVNEEPMSHKWRDHMFYYGDISFITNFTRIMAMKHFTASIEFLEEVHIHSEEERRHVAATVQAAIEAKYIPIPAEN